jgi:hypothetical protein
MALMAPCSLGAWSMSVDSHHAPCPSCVELQWGGCRLNMGWGCLFGAFCSCRFWPRALGLCWHDARMRGVVLVCSCALMMLSLELQRSVRLSGPGRVHAFVSWCGLPRAGLVSLRALVYAWSHVPCLLSLLLVLALTAFSLGCWCDRLSNMSQQLGLRLGDWSVRGSVCAGYRCRCWVVWCFWRLQPR